MAATQANIKKKTAERNSLSPARAMSAVLVTMDTDVNTPWINKTGMAVVTFSWRGQPARTVQFMGRYLDDDGAPIAGTDHLIGDKDGVPITLDLSTSANAEGSSFPIDTAATADQIRAIVSAVSTDKFVFSFGG